MSDPSPGTLGGRVVVCPCLIMQPASSTRVAQEGLVRLVLLHGFNQAHAVRGGQRRRTVARPAGEAAAARTELAHVSLGVHACPE